MLQNIAEDDAYIYCEKNNLFKKSVFFEKKNYHRFFFEDPKKLKNPIKPTSTMNFLNLMKLKINCEMKCLKKENYLFY